MKVLLLVALVLVTVSCATIQQATNNIHRGEALRHTSNPQATAGCRFAATLYNGDETAGEWATNVPLTNEEYIVFVPPGVRNNEVSALSSGPKTELYACPRPH